MSKPKIIVILGPTASGKSDLAIKLAQKFNGEVVSADSRQVYKELNIGTGKASKREMQGVPHHMLSVVNFKKVFTVAEYKKQAEKAIEKILANGKLPIICGGTGFYIQALVDGIVLPEVEPNQNLRKKLEKKSTIELFEILKRLDPERAKNIDSKNPVRLVRAIEIAKALGKSPKLESRDMNYEVCKIGIKIEDEILKQRINKRLASRIKLGMIAEAKRLHAKGMTYKRMRELGLEYRYLADFLENKITKQELIQKLETEIWHYAKRQMTWFKRDASIKWFTLSNTRELEPKISKIEKEVRRFL